MLSLRMVLCSALFHCVTALLTMADEGAAAKDTTNNTDTKAAADFMTLGGAV